MYFEQEALCVWVLTDGKISMREWSKSLVEDTAPISILLISKINMMNFQFFFFPP